MKTLLIVEGASNIKAATYQVRSACKGEVDAVTFTDYTADELQSLDVHNIFVSKAVSAEQRASAIKNIAGNYDWILMSHSTTGKNLMPYLAGLLNTPMISDIWQIKDDTIVRGLYAGSVQQEQALPTKLLATIKSAKFEAHHGSNEPKVQELTAGADVRTTEFVKLVSPDADKIELESARVVISGGRGLKSKESFDKLAALAQKLGAAIGATRAAVDAGFAANDLQVGQTGKTVAPELYVAVGISGATQHLAGMKDSKTIIAVNKDADAPIFQIADLGFVGTWEQLEPVLEELANGR